jgi:hypothetical protein
MTSLQICICGGRPVPVRLRRRFAGFTTSPRDRISALSAVDADFVSAPVFRGNRPTTVLRVAARDFSFNPR